MRNFFNLYDLGEYLAHNPTWGEEDSPWKAQKIYHLLSRHGIVPQKVCEVGCGAGGILAALRDCLPPTCRLVGYDITPVLEDFWKKHSDTGITFILGDFLESDPHECYDIILLIDVLEHLENPFAMLRGVRRRARWFVFHIPVELQAIGALRGSPFMLARNTVGHLHFWNKDLALALLEDCGMEVIDWEYTATAVELPTSLLTRRLMAWPRRLLSLVAPHLAARFLGGICPAGAGPAGKKVSAPRTG